MVSSIGVFTSAAAVSCSIAVAFPRLAISLADSEGFGFGIIDSTLFAAVGILAVSRLISALSAASQRNHTPRRASGGNTDDTPAESAPEDASETANESAAESDEVAASGKSHDCAESSADDRADG